MLHCHKAAIVHEKTEKRKIIKWTFKAKSPCFEFHFSVIFKYGSERMIFP